MRNDIYGEYTAVTLARPITERAVAWLRWGETGLSSMTIFNCLAPKELQFCPFKKEHVEPFSPSVPCDISDFRRCWLLLRLIPEWRSRLHEVAERHSGWKSLVEHWDELEKLYINEREKGYSKLFNTRLHEVMGWK